MKQRSEYRVRGVISDGSDFMGKNNIDNSELKQGHSTATILTNRSKHQTIIRPYAEQKPLKPPSFSKGTRWMHRTTLTLEKKKCNDALESSMQASYNGQNMASPPQRQRRCPSLHKSHIELGTNEQLHLRSHYNAEYPGRTIVHPNKLHYPSIVNWSHNVIGHDMKDVLIRKNNSPNYWSSYANVHSRLGLKLGEGIPQPAKPKVQYNLITGQESGPANISCQRLVSGNRVLSQTRDQTGESFVLG